MKKLTVKQENFLNLILNFYNVNKYFPNTSELKKLTNLKSYTALYKYMDALERKNILKYDKKSHQIIAVNRFLKGESFLSIPFLNQDNYLKIKELDNNSFVLRIANNDLKSYGIYLNDLVVIDTNLTYLKNKFVVIKDEDKYKIYKYEKKDSFHYLINDKEELIFENTKIILGKVVSLIRDM